MNYAQIRPFDISNGKGIGCTLFVSGCTHKCKGCFQPEAWDFNYGQIWNKQVEEQFLEMCKNPKVDHVAILGGEPFQQDADTLYRLVRRIAEEARKPIWIWTGYVFEAIPKCHRHTLDYIEIVVDGKFIESEKDLMLAYRGSRNQRVIDVKETLRKGEVVLYCE